MDWRVDQLSEREVYKLLVNTVMPRPIALVTTQDTQGQLNAAPFSFFNVMGSDPPVIALGLEGSAANSDSLKDTTRNIEANGAFVVNLIDESMVNAMTVCGIDFPPEVNEIEAARFTLAPSRQVIVPRIAESPVQFECREHTTLKLGERNRRLVIAEIVHIHVRDELLEGPFRIDPDRLAVVGRLHGDGWYTRIRDRFQVPRLRLEDWPGADDDGNPKKSDAPARGVSD